MSMSNLRARPAPPPGKSQPKPPAYKNPANKAPIPPRTQARAASAPGKPRPGALKPTPSKNPQSGQQQQQAKAGNWINRTVQSYVQGYGNYVGGYVNSLGNGVNKVGEGISNSISNTTRGWGQGVAGYGNNIKDQVGVGGPRVATAGNPLGLAGTGSATRSLPMPMPKKTGVNKKAGPGNPLGL